MVAERLQERFFRVSVAARLEEIPKRPWSVVVDGLFGIGLAREITGEHAALVEYANRQRCPVLALDIPSGIHADTGRVLGCAVRATHTVTFIALKPGLLTLDGPDHCGEIHLEKTRPGRRPLHQCRRGSPNPPCSAAPAQAAAAQLPQGESRLGGDHRRRRRHERRGPARGARRAETGRGRVYVGLLDESVPSISTTWN